jgi:predicted Zn-dependent protease with MMP-like domain
VRQEIGDLEEALVLARRAMALAPHEAFVRVSLASILYDLCDFDAGLEAAGQALEADPADPFAHHLAGLLLDMNGRRAEADTCFEEAERLDPVGFPRPPVLDETGFRRALAEAEAALPPEFRRHLREVPVVVQDLPPRELLATLDQPSADLLGLFVGVPRTLKSTHDLPGPPDTIYLFKRNLERACFDADDLVEQIGVTLLHELGHYLGMEEDDLDEAGYA